MGSEKKLKSVHAIISKSVNKEDAVPGSSSSSSSSLSLGSSSGIKMKEETIKIVEGNMADAIGKKSKITESFTDKERIKMEEEGLSEKDFEKIPVSDDDCADFESITPHNESCWADKDLVKLEDLGNWTDLENLSPRSEEDDAASKLTDLE